MCDGESLCNGDCRSVDSMVAAGVVSAMVAAGSSRRGLFAGGVASSTTMTSSFINSAALNIFAEKSERSSSCMRCHFIPSALHMLRTSPNLQVERCVWRFFFHFLDAIWLRSHCIQESSAGATVSGHQSKLPGITQKVIANTERAPSRDRNAIGSAAATAVAMRHQDP